MLFHDKNRNNCVFLPYNNCFLYKNCILSLFLNGCISPCNNHNQNYNIYLPSNILPSVYGINANLPGPTPYGTALSVFRGTNPNGIWSLFALDDLAEDSGNIGNGWTIEFEVGYYC
ncbi:hypothetical protein AR454_00890 [Bacillus mycoides]|uniref:hypothetical protein n=1 Tax=Bacillus mycoides TaxID=1405 RepID=UPI001E399AC2|nr:hypothetical protein [Bacillus mycoides]MCD4642140.1 hypothetical protein [Bacillus mycoides]